MLNDLSNYNGYANFQVGLLPLAFNLGNVDYLMGNRDESNPEPLWEEQRGREVICWKACPAFSH
jgi:hypothetical protein